MNDVRRTRCALVWLVTTAAAAATSAAAGPSGASALGAGVRDGRFDSALVGCCSLALAACALWAWLVTSSVVGDLLRRPAAVRDYRAVGIARRLVLVACGVALTGALAGPALATPGPLLPRHVQAHHPGRPEHAVRDPLAVALAGLPLPDRALDQPVRHVHVAPPVAPDSPTPEQHPPPASTRRSVVVRSGDSLWSIAARTLAASGRATDAASVDRAWREIYAANRDLIGADPDVITPATRLRLPNPTQETR